MCCVANNWHGYFRGPSRSANPRGLQKVHCENGPRANLQHLPQLLSQLKVKCEEAYREPPFPQQLQLLLSQLCHCCWHSDGAGQAHGHSQKSNAVKTEIYLSNWKKIVFHNLKHFRASSWCLAVSRGFQSICGCWREGAHLWHMPSFFPPLKDQCEEAH